jgi:hypothetical protein
MKESTSKMLVAIAVGLAAALLVFVLSKAAGGPAKGDAPSTQMLTYTIGTLILVLAGNWALLSRLTIGQYVRNTGIWLGIGAVSFALYRLLYPGGG